MLGERHAKDLLAHPQLLPPEALGKNLLFIGTIWVVKYELKGEDEPSKIKTLGLSAPVLFWSAGKHVPGFIYLDVLLNDSFRLLRVKK